MASESPTWTCFRAVPHSGLGLVGDLVAMRTGTPVWVWAPASLWGCCGSMLLRAGPPEGPEGPSGCVRTRIGHSTLSAHSSHREARESVGSLLTPGHCLRSVWTESGQGQALQGPCLLMAWPSLGFGVHEQTEAQIDQETLGSAGPDTSQQGTPTLDGRGHEHMGVLSPGSRPRAQAQAEPEGSRGWGQTLHSCAGFHFDLGTRSETPRSQ